MDNSGFQAALDGRVDDMLSACTKCGACFTACPITGAAGVGDANPSEVVAGELDIVRLGAGPKQAQTRAKSCVLSGQCIRVCDCGVSPLFLLARARLAMTTKTEPRDRRKAGVTGFRRMSEDVGILSHLQLTDEVLERLGQRPTAKPQAESEELPDVVFYTGCNVLKTPHIALLCLDIMDALGTRYSVMGGPTHCCGVHQLRAGDAETSSRFAGNTIGKLARSKTGEVISWCPSCFVQFSEIMLPTFERATGEKPFDMTPFMRFLRRNLDALRPLLTKRVEMKIALHRHPGVAGGMAAAEAGLGAVPGIEIARLDVPAVGLQSVNLAVLPKYKKELQLRELDAAAVAGVDALVAVYHSDHRELCAHERDWPFKIMNILEVVGASMGLRQDDHYKNLKIKQDVDAIISDSADLMKQHKVDLDTARKVIVNGMLGDQPLPLQGKQPAL